MDSCSTIVAPVGSEISKFTSSREEKLSRRWVDPALIDYAWRADYLDTNKKAVQTPPNYGYIAKAQTLFFSITLAA